MNFSSTECTLIKYQSKSLSNSLYQYYIKMFPFPYNTRIKPLSTQNESNCFLTTLYVNKKDTI